MSLIEAESRPTAVVAATTTWQDFPSLWGQLLGEVWDCLHAGGIHRGCRNIMLYLDSVPNVEVGVLLDKAMPAHWPRGGIRAARGDRGHDRPSRPLR